MLKSNFFIVGALKSGTTALYEFLKQHPNVYFGKKEICYFCPDLTLRTPHITEDIYMRYYRDATNQKAVGDGYVYHIVSKEAAKEIKAFNPNAKIIIMLRNPVEMVYSLHSNLVYNGDEPLEDFEQALDAEADRRAGKQIPEHYRCPLESMFYSSIAKYYEQVLRYQAVFPPDKIHVIFFEDFTANQETEYKKVLKFLDLVQIMPESFGVVNPSQKTKSKTFLNFLTNPPGFVKATGRFFFPHHTKRREWFIDRLWNMNTKHEPKPPLSPALKKRLIEMYKEDIENLGKLFNRDLSNWTKI